MHQSQIIDESAHHGSSESSPFHKVIASPPPVLDCYTQSIHYDVCLCVCVCIQISHTTYPLSVCIIYVNIHRRLPRLLDGSAHTHTHTHINTHGKGIRDDETHLDQ